MSTSLPQKIGRYEIVGELGRGAMGVVYKATDPNIGRMVALKTMRLEVHGVDEAEMLRRFRHEAKLAGVMNHPNIVTIYDAGEDEGVFYIAMEYMEGVTLQTILHAERAISTERMLEISRQMCLGLDYAHERGVIHRDIKPANIMIHGGGVKIMDFGIAKSGGGLTSAGQVLGTPAYMSPEQVRGKTLDGRSDLFSYGVCLYEMITGEKPFSGQNVTTIIYKIMTETPIPPRELDVTIHPGISAVVTKALAKIPDERHQNGAELLRELESYKSFGSSGDTTKMMSAVSTGAHAAAVSPALAPAPVAATEASTMNIRAAEPNIAAVIASGEKHRVLASKIAGKVGAVESIESTVRVSHPVTNSTSMFDKTKLAIIGGIVIVLLGLGVVFSKKRPEVPPQKNAAPTQASAQNPNATEKKLPEAQNAKIESPISEAAKDERVTADKPPASVPKKQSQKTKPPTLAAAVPASVPVWGVPAANPELGSMHIVSTPAGAKVSIGSTSQEDWVTPFTAHKLAPGDYELTIAKAGFITQKRHVSVVAGKSGNMGVDLVEAGAKITVTSKPVGAAILVDGKPSGKVTPAVLIVDAGTHHLMVRQTGYAEENTSVNLKDGETYTFAPTLQAKRAGGGNPFRGIKKMFGGGEAIPEGKGVVQIRTNPEGAIVMHNGKAISKTTPAKFPMDPGTYQVTIRLEGYKPMRREFTVEKGKSTDVEVNLVAK
jgi:serine/threonine protein kinase